MKVKCIKQENNGAWRGFVKKKFFWSKGKIYRKGPRYGDVVTVEKEYWDDGGKYYHFIEWPNGNGYLSTYFEPLEEQDEKFETVTFEKIKEKTPIYSN